MRGEFPDIKNTKKKKGKGEHKPCSCIESNGYHEHPSRYRSAAFSNPKETK